MKNAYFVLVLLALLLGQGESSAASGSRGARQLAWQPSVKCIGIAM